MDSEKSAKIFSHKTKYNDDGGINLSVEKINEIYSQGFKKIKLLFTDFSENTADEKILNLELFYKIKNLQGLPEFVVRDFLVAKGKLNNTNIEERIKF